MKKTLKVSLEVLIVAAVIILLAIAVVSMMSFEQTSTAEQAYLIAVEEEQQAYGSYLDSQQYTCTKEKALAKAKLSDFFNGKRPLESDEDLFQLTQKSEWLCDQFIDVEEMNFTETSEAGIDEFLKVNGAEFVKEAGSTFTAVGETYGLKPEVLVCIAQADSSLGRHLKTGNNIGNVGNNDRGDTNTYATLEGAIEAMGQVLNNQYLGGYSRLGELSGGGRQALGIEPCGKCYATSMYNWNKNVKGCLAEITKQPVDESFNFRK